MFVSSKLQRLKNKQTIFSVTFVNLFIHQMVNLLLLINENDLLCYRCNLQEAVIRCIECVQYGTYLCYSCDDEVHSLSPFNDQEVFPNGFFQNIKPTISVDAKGCLVTISEYLKYIFNR